MNINPQKIPSVDEQELELWERLIKESLELGTEITITYLANSEIKSVSGAVKCLRRLKMTNC